MRHVIEVTQGDIDAAVLTRRRRLAGELVEKLSSSCPVALAVKRALGVEWVSVWEDEIEAGSGRRLLFRIATLPPEVGALMEAFDEFAGEVQPISFEVEDAL